MDIKKIITIIVFVLVVVGLGFALYYVFFRSDAPGLEVNQNFNSGNLPDIGNGNISVINTNTNQNVNGLPWQQYVNQPISEVANGGLTEVTKVTDTSVDGLIAGYRGLQYYDKDSQQFFYLDEDGRPRLLADKKFFQVSDITWTKSGEKAILEYPDGSNILYNFRTGKQVTLPIELQEFSFTSDGSQIVAKWLGETEENNWLVAANDDGSGLYLIEPLGDQSHNVQSIFSPDGQVAALNTKYVDAQRQEVYPIGLHGENFTSFVVNGAGFTADWSPQGTSLLYSVYNENTSYQPNLWVTKGTTSQLGEIKVSLNLSTWPDKCAFASESTLYCAVPQGLPRGAGFYPEVADQFPDNFYVVDLNTGNKSLIASPVGDGGSYSAYNLFFSSDGSTLYFTDRATGRLQSIRLK